MHPVSATAAMRQRNRALMPRATMAGKLPPNHSAGKLFILGVQNLDGHGLHLCRN